MARPREFDETEALDRAVDVFWEHGFEGTSISDLEAATGVGRQSLYNVFGGKRELFLRALDRYAARTEARETAGPDAGLDGLRTFLHESIEFLVEGRRGCFKTKALLEDPAAPDVSSRCGLGQDHVHALARQWIRAAVRDGSARADLDPEVAARLVSTHAHGISAAAAAGVPADELEAGVDWLIRSFEAT